MFYYLCYEGSVDLDDIDDIAKRHALEVQISEFGQIPKQLFKQPHVPRMVDIPESITLRGDSFNESAERVPSLDEVDRRMSMEDGSAFSITGNVVLDYEFQPHRLGITSMFYEAKTKTIYSTSQDGTLKIFDWTTKQQTRSVNLGTMPISSCVRIPETDIFILGCWDNTV